MSFLVTIIFFVAIIVFFSNPLLLGRLLQQYRPGQIPNNCKNKLIWQSYFLIFRKKLTLHAFFINNRNSNNLKYQQDSKEK